MNVTYINTPYALGSTVRVSVVSADDPITLQNDLTQASTQIPGLGDSDVDTIVRYGVFRQTFIDSTSAVDCLLIVSASDGFIVQSATNPEDTDLLKRFFAALTTDRAERAWAAWDKDAFLAANAVALATGLGFEVACAYSMGSVAAACMVAADQLKGVLLEASVAFLLKLVEVMGKDQVFTTPEIDEISKIIGEDHDRILLASVEGIADAIAALSSIVIDHEVSNPDLKLTLTLQKDVFGKAHAIWKVLQP